MQAHTYSSSLSSSFLSSHLFSYKVLESRVSVTFVILLRNYYKSVEWNFSFLFFFLNWMIVVYNAVLITSLQQSDSVIHIYTFFFYYFPWWFIMGLNIVLCVIQKDLVFLQFLLYLLGQFLQWRLHFCKSTMWWKLEAGTRGETTWVCLFPWEPASPRCPQFPIIFPLYCLPCWPLMQQWP